MAFTGKYIVVGVDGTDSHKWRKEKGVESHVFKFLRDMKLQGGKKKHFEGPGEDFGGTVLGAGSGEIIDKGVKFIYRQLRIMAPAIFGPRLTRMNSPRRTLKEINEELKQAETAIRVVLVGHSRGGLIAINIARQLPMKVWYMGLYDAVDRHPLLDGDTIRNVRTTFHALRHDVMNSRGTFSNCGLKSEGKLFMQSFMTSHGGTGGDITIVPDDITDDISCARGTLTANISAALGTDRTQLCLDNSAAADLYIRGGARSCGIIV